MDFPFNLTGILYFPKVKKEMDLQRNKIHLYSNQVFITDNVENIVPDFLTLLHGVIDSPDIPLNVSRSYLQEDANVKKITSHISKKVSDKLAKMFKDDRADFAAKWNDIQVFTEYGMLMDEKFFERAGKFALYADTEATTAPWRSSWSPSRRPTPTRTAMWSCSTRPTLLHSTAMWPQLRMPDTRCSTWRAR